MKSISLLAITVLLFAFLNCNTTKNITIENKITGLWKIDSLNYFHQVDLKIEKNYQKEISEIVKNSQIEFKKDNTFSFNFGNEKMEGVWFTTIDEKILITQGFTTREKDSFEIAFPENGKLILNSSVKGKEIFMILSK